MAEIKGNRLFVNLGASQTRKRVKGIGYGIRKVQSVGRNQAVIIHTATGEHLRELEAIFADVQHSSVERELGTPIGNLPNLGSASAAWLRDAGIDTLEKLASCGPVAAYRLVQQRHPQAPFDLLWALAAGLSGRRASELTDDERSRLREALQ
jgi:hypothetical protein